MFKYNKIIVFFGIIDLILSILLLIIFNFIKDNAINKHLESVTDSNVQKYNVIYNEYKKLSNVLYIERINTPEVKKIFAGATSKDEQTRFTARLELYDYLKDSYDFFKTLNIKQFHFHLPNNDSFLRFHKPKKYGDNLTDIRATVKYVNDNHKKVDGFEEGRLYSGYRFVFPMFSDSHKYLGSVEASFSTITMSVEFERNYKRTALFLANKENALNKLFKSEKNVYKDSQYKDFVIEKKLIKKLSKDNKIVAFKKVSKKTQDIVHKRLESKKSFSLYDVETNKVLTFIKVLNTMTHKAVGMLIVYNDSEYIMQVNKIFTIALYISYAFILLVLFFIYKELKYRNELEDKIAKAIRKSQIRDKAMLQQSKLAQMGEMISMIAHQWRQPLSAISATSGSLSLKSELGTLDDETAKELADKITDYAQHLSLTIDDFREFFRPKKEEKETTYNEIIKSVLGIIETTIVTKDIKIVQDLTDNGIFKSYPNEIKQVVLNLLKNAEDVLLEKAMQNAYIKIRTYKKDNYHYLEVSDNAGGIPDDIIDKIFEPYFSTKTQKDGTGLGLYMSKIIIEEHCNGKLSVSNDENGAVFIVELYSSK